MEAFRSVDKLVAKPVYQSETQSDWANWTSGAGKDARGMKKKTVYGQTRHQPSFPKLGHSSVSRIDDSNYEVGMHDDVHVPTAVLEQPGKKKKRAAEAAAEDEGDGAVVLKKPRAAGDGDGAAADDEDDDSDSEWVGEEAAAPAQVLRAGAWSQLKDPETGAPYYFNQMTGETTSTKPDEWVRAETQQAKAAQRSAELELDFEPASAFDGSRPGFVFKLGPRGLGYYADGPSGGSVGGDSASTSASSAAASGQRGSRVATAAATTSGDGGGSSATAPPAAGGSTNPLDQVQAALARRAATSAAASVGGSGVGSAGGAMLGGHQAAVAKQQWESVRDPLTHRTYWYNKFTKATSWTKPEALLQAEAGGGGGVWKSVLDPSSGKHYWYNTSTRAVTWSKPQG